MKLFRIAVAALLVVFASGTFASVDLFALGRLNPGDSKSFGNSVASWFIDSWTFDLSADSFVAASATNVEIKVFSTASGGISGFGGMLNGAALDVNPPIVTAASPVTITVLVLSGSGLLTAGGPYTLAISGTGLSGPNASYGGNLTVTAVPEPETYAMMLAGLGVLGFLATRRRREG